MKYLVRSLKYFIWFALVLAIIMVIMALLGMVEFNLEAMFRDGMKSVWQIVILFAVVALVYPLTGFRKFDVIIPGEFAEIKDKFIRVMESKGYVLETQEGEDMTFRLRSMGMRAVKMFEDRITFTRTPTGFEAEGLRKIVVRIVSALEHAFRNDEQDDYSK